MKDTVRLNFEFSMSEYPYLKLMRVEKGISFRDFATKLLRNMNSDDNIPFEKVKGFSSAQDQRGIKSSIVDPLPLFKEHGLEIIGLYIPSMIKNLLSF